MFPSVCSLVDFNENKPPKGKFILLSDSQNDGSFLVNHFLSLYAKGGFHICFMTLSQSFTHYCNVAQKLGINLNTACDNGQVKHIDGLKLISKGLSAKQNKDEALNTEKNPFVNVRNLNFSLEELYKQIRSWVTVKGNEPCLLLIDDISILLSLGVTVKTVKDFCHYCTDLMCYDKNVVSGCFVCLVHCDADVDDDMSMLLLRQLCHMAHIEMHVEGLSSGYCKDVHGQLVITWREPDDPRPKPYKKTTTQYKIQDRMVTFFAPGTSKAVL
ncbi:elongator complex protein 6-like [Actinia tenebrosa]|uniref:Elongator complex protein 6 n=1 Tax=Actinia tenebrosa TaxID=6105 RepID=A0A6P8I1V3_ACTTE|nr:elongator complex protein 6-like [Actinia tenebrosa]